MRNTILQELHAEYEQRQQQNQSCAAFLHAALLFIASVHSNSSCLWDRPPSGP